MISFWKLFSMAKEELLNSETIKKTVAETVT